MEGSSSASDNTLRHPKMRRKQEDTSPPTEQGTNTIRRWLGSLVLDPPRVQDERATAGASASSAMRAAVSRVLNFVTAFPIATEERLSSSPTPLSSTGFQRHIPPNSDATQQCGDKQRLMVALLGDAATPRRGTCTLSDHLPTSSFKSCTTPFVSSSGRVSSGADGGTTESGVSRCSSYMYESTSGFALFQPDNCNAAVEIAMVDLTGLSRSSGSANRFLVQADVVLLVLPLSTLLTLPCHATAGDADSAGWTDAFRQLLTIIAAHCSSSDDSDDGACPLAPSPLLFVVVTTDDAYQSKQHNNSPEHHHHSGKQDSLSLLLASLRRFCEEEHQRLCRSSSSSATTLPTIPTVSKFFVVNAESGGCTAEDNGGPRTAAEMWVTIIEMSLKQRSAHAAALSFSPSRGIDHQRRRSCTEWIPAAVPLSAREARTRAEWTSQTHSPVPTTSQQQQQQQQHPSSVPRFDDLALSSSAHQHVTQGLRSLTSLLERYCCHASVQVLLVSKLWKAAAGVLRIQSRAKLYALLGCLEARGTIVVMRRAPPLLATTGSLRSLGRSNSGSDPQVIRKVWGAEARKNGEKGWDYVCLRPALLMRVEDIVFRQPDNSNKGAVLAIPDGMMDRSRLRELARLCGCVNASGALKGAYALLQVLILAGYAFVPGQAFPTADVALGGEQRNMRKHRDSSEHGSVLCVMPSLRDASRVCPAAFIVAVRMTSATLLTTDTHMCATVAFEVVNCPADFFPTLTCRLSESLVDVGFRDALWLRRTIYSSTSSSSLHELQEMKETYDSSCQQRALVYLSQKNDEVIPRFPLLEMHIFSDRSGGALLLETELMYQLAMLLRQCFPGVRLRECMPPAVPIAWCAAGTDATASTTAGGEVLGELDALYTAHCAQ